MISLCIPIYNYDVRPMVKSLHQQATEAAIPFEILLIDDGSREIYRQKNRECMALANVMLEELDANIGRSRIRNMLAQKARFPWLIFMDCDSACPDTQFIKRYLFHTEVEGVICGGTSYLSRPPSEQTYLHWLFGSKREVKPHHQRAHKPNHSFMSNNFMISSKIIRRIGFNERLRGYGHEDTLFGLELLKNNIKTTHIDNPLLHMGLQSADDFLVKTKEGTYNLLTIYRLVNEDRCLVEMAKLLKAWRLLRKLGLCAFVGLMFSVFEPALVKNLRSHHPKLAILDLYKLGSLCSQWKDQKKSLHS